MDKQKLIDKTKSLGCLGLLLVLLMAASCKTGHHGDPAVLTDAQNEASYTLVTLPFDETERAFYNSKREIRKIVNDLPYFGGITMVDAITDTHARMTYQTLPTAQIPMKYRGRDFDYVFELYNDEGELILNPARYFYVGEEPKTTPQQTLRLTFRELTPDTVYRVRMFVEFTDDEGRRCTSYDRRMVRFRTNSYPPKPTAVFLKHTDQYYPTPYRSLLELSSLVSTATSVKLRISYYGAGTPGYAAVRFYADPACTDFVGETTTKTSYGQAQFPYYEYEVAGPLAQGQHRFYAKFVNALGNSSPCSTAYASYTVVECPEDYVVIQPDQELKVPAFCLMKTEARHGDDDVAVPGYSDSPWEATPQEAKDACRRAGPSCDLITNLEWMAVAKQLESYNGNWSSSYVGNGYLNKGNTIDDLGVLNISDSSNEYDQLTSNNFQYRRTFKLLTGTLWDFGGNLAEWADNAQEGGPTFQPITNSCAQGPFELLDPEFSCPDLNSLYYTPWTKRSNLDGDAYQTYNHANINLGRIVGPADLDQNSATSLAAARGGQAEDEANSGIYSLFMFNHMADTNGFRCVCHLTE